MAACVAAFAVPAMAQTKWNLPAAYPADNPHSVNLIAFAKDVGDATAWMRNAHERNFYVLEGAIEVETEAGELAYAEFVVDLDARVNFLAA